MDYEMEELVPIVGKLAEKYTSHESTSITCEKAELVLCQDLAQIKMRNFSSS